jgi:hypothetical protein
VPRCHVIPPYKIIISLPPNKRRTYPPAKTSIRLGLSFTRAPPQSTEYAWSTASFLPRADILTSCLFYLPTIISVPTIAFGI